MTHKHNDQGYQSVSIHSASADARHPEILAYVNGSPGLAEAKQSARRRNQSNYLNPLHVEEMVKGGYKSH